jgi:hypothetical protein
MAENGEDDILFRIGFEEHPEAKSNLVALGDAAITMQKSISESITKTGQTAEQVANRIEQLAGKRQETAADKASGGSSSTIDLGKSQATSQALMKQAIGTMDKLNDAFGRAGQEFLISQQLAVDEAMQQLENAFQTLEDARSPDPNVRATVDTRDIDRAQLMITEFYANEVERREEDRNNAIKVAEEKAKIAEKLAKDEANAAKKAADAAIQERERDRKAAIKAREAAAKEFERFAKEEKDNARDVANAHIEAYDAQIKSAQQAASQIKRTHSQLMQSGRELGVSFGKVARGAVLLGFAEGENANKALKQLAKVQAAIDLISGSFTGIKAVVDGYKSIKAAIAAMVIAKQADAASAKIAQNASDALKNALYLEALSAKEAAAAHDMLARSRERGEGAGGGGGGGRSTSGGKGRAAMRFVNDPIGSIGEGVLDKLIMKLAGPLERLSKLFRKFGGVTKSLMGSLSSTILGVGGKLASGLGMAIGGGALALGGAGAAAVGGTVFAVTSLVESIKDAMKNGIGGGGEVGGYTDTIATGLVNASDALFGFIDRISQVSSVFAFLLTPLTLLADAFGYTKRKEEEAAIARAEAALKERQMRAAHMAELGAIEIRGARQIADIRKRTEQDILNTRLGGAKTEADKLKLINEDLAKTAEKKARLDKRVASLKRNDDGVFDPGGNAEEQARVKDLLTEEAELTQRLIDLNQMRQDQLRSQDRTAEEAARKQQDALEKQVRTIEELIRAKARERDEAKNAIDEGRKNLGKLDETEQQIAAEAFNQAKKQGASSLKDWQADLLSRIGGSQIDQILADRDQAKGRKGGRDKLFFSDEMDQATQANADRQQAIRDLAGKTGISEQDLTAQANKDPTKVEIVDRTQIKVEFKAQNENLVAQIADTIVELLSQRGDELGAAVKTEVLRQSQAANAKEKARIDARDAASDD